MSPGPPFEILSLRGGGGLGWFAQVGGEAVEDG